MLEKAEHRWSSHATGFIVRPPKARPGLNAVKNSIDRLPNKGIFNGNESLDRAFDAGQSFFGTLKHHTPSENIISWRFQAQTRFLENVKSRKRYPSENVDYLLNTSGKKFNNNSQSCRKLPEALLLLHRRQLGWFSVSQRVLSQIILNWGSIRCISLNSLGSHSENTFYNIKAKFD